jgi:hypothetical protein
MDFFRSCFAVLVVNCFLDIVTLYQSQRFNNLIIDIFYGFFDPNFVFSINQMQLFEKYILTFIFLVTMKVFD